MTSIPIEIKKENLKFVSLEDSGNSGLNLVSTATNLTLSVSNCASGYTFSSSTMTSGLVNLYKGDRNCLVKLTSFTLGSVTYSTLGGTDFTSWLSNDVATFKDVSSSGTIKVFVSSQVTQSGVQGSDLITYKFTDTTAAATSNMSNVSVQTPVPLSVTGQSAPNFDLVQARYLSTNPNGTANLSFTLQCGSTLTGSSLATYACSSVLLNSQLDYIFISDTYSQGNLTVAQAAAAFASHTPSSVNSLIVASQGSDLDGNMLPRGGFYTSNASPLTTENSVFMSGLNNLFLLRAKDAGGNTLSYLYFYVTIGSNLQVSDLVIRNGSFEQGNHPMNTGFVRVQSNLIFHMDYWYLTNKEVDWVHTGWTASNGSLSLDMDGSGSSGTAAGGAIAQDLSTVVGASYTVYFDMAANPAGSTVKNLRVSAGGTSQDYSFDRTGYSTSNMGWTTKSFTFTATSTTTALEFRSLSSSGTQGAALDNVRTSP